MSNPLPTGTGLQPWPLRVFISSVRRGLEEERDSLPQVIRDQGHRPIRFEDLAAQGRTPRFLCIEGVRRSDVYLLLVGSTYGEPLPDTGKAPTEEEFDAAKASDIPIIALVKTGVAREALQEQFLARVEDYRRGVFRAPFESGEDLIGAVARSLAHAAHDFRIRRVMDAIRKGGPVDPVIAVDWRRLFERYYGIWSMVFGLKFDFETYYERKSQDINDRALSEYAYTSMWYFARFLYLIERLVQDRGGLWLLADADDEIAVADATYRIRWHPPLTERNHSALRLNIAQAESFEYLAFLERLREDEQGEEIEARWLSWMDACSCESSLSPECEVHTWLSFCDLYIDRIDVNWIQLAEWYQLPPSHLARTTIQIKELYRTYPFRLDQ